MVYFPKPGLLTEWGYELVGCLIFYYITATAVAHTGGSLAFAANGAVVALAVGFGLLAIIATFSSVHLFPHVTLGMWTHDLIKWTMMHPERREGFWYTFRYIGHLIIQVVAAILAALLTWASSSESAPIFLGIPQVVTTNNGVALGLAIVVSFFFEIVWMWATEVASPAYLFGMNELTNKREMRHPQAPRDGKTLLWIGQGQLSLRLCDLFRGFTIGLANAVFTIITQPVVGWILNPTLYLGYAIVSANFPAPDWWVHIWFPFIGAFAGFIVYLLLVIFSTYGPMTKYFGYNGKSKLI